MWSLGNRRCVGCPSYRVTEQGDYCHDERYRNAALGCLRQTVQVGDSDVSKTVSSEWSAEMGAIFERKLRGVRPVVVAMQEGEPIPAVANPPDC